MQTLVIGDIHGCYEEVQALLDQAGLGEADRIVSLGDCVDRGPATPAVLKFFQETPRAQLLMGNHERKHVRASRHEVKLARSQQISRVQFGEAYPQALAYMSSLPLYLDLPEALLVHGFFEPGLPLDQQKPIVLCGTMGGEKHLQSRYDHPWYELYDGDKPILVGHNNYTDTDQPFVHRERVFGLDTSCVTGKALTGLLLPSFRFVSVPSRANHWLQVRRLYPSHPHPPPSRVEFSWSVSDLEELYGWLSAITREAAELMQELQADPAFAGLPARKQAKRFAARAGKGAHATLLHLARVGQLDEPSARRILKSPDAMLSLGPRSDDTGGTGGKTLVDI